jgi:uncharacterized protein (DUF433 family)
LLERLLRRISINRKAIVGKIVIRGMRISVELLVKMLAQGISEKEILQEYPRLKPEDIKAALAYTSAVLINKEICHLFSEQPSRIPSQHHLHLRR